MTIVNPDATFSEKHEIAPLKLQRRVEGVIDAVTKQIEGREMNVVGAGVVRLIKDRAVELQLVDRRKDENGQPNNPWRIIVDTRPVKSEVRPGVIENRVIVLVDNLLEGKEINMDTDQQRGLFIGDNIMETPYRTWRVVELPPGTYVMGRKSGANTGELPAQQLDRKVDGHIWIPADRDSGISRDSLVINVSGNGRVWVEDISTNRVCRVDDRGVEDRRHFFQEMPAKDNRGRSKRDN